MSRSYPANTQIQKFLEESYNKERDARLGWFVRGKAGEEQRSSKQLDVFRKKIEAAAPKPSERLLELRDIKPKSYHKRTMKHDDNLLKLAAAKQTSRDGDLMVDMRPVTPHTRGKLYDGFTKEGKGRYQYLMDRYQTIPEAKYQFPVLSSWEYGWRLSDVIKKEEIKKPPFGRTRIVADTFYTRTGIPGLRRSQTTIY